MSAPLQQLYPGGIPAVYRTDLQLKTPVYLLGICTSLLQQFFGSTQRIVLEKSSFVWNPDPSVSQVYINYQDNADYSTVGKRPAIIVSLGDTEFPREVVGDIMSYNGKDGTFDILDIAKGQWVCTCLSDDPLEALALATEVKYFLQTYRRYISQTYGFDTLRTARIGKWQKQPEYKDYYGCATVIDYQIQDNFAVGAESLKVAGISLNFTAPAS